MDNDPAGRKLAGLVEEAVKQSGRADLVFRRDLPSKEGSDWNDVLKERAFGAAKNVQANSFPLVRVALLISSL
jgi:hypothetical protein